MALCSTAIRKCYKVYIFFKKDFSLKSNFQLEEQKCFFILVSEFDSGISFLSGILIDWFLF